MNTPHLKGYDGPFYGYYFKDYHPNYINKKYTSLNDITHIKKNITIEKNGLITIRKNGILHKSSKLNDKTFEISYKYINITNKSPLNNPSFEQIIYNKQIYYINFKHKLFYNKSLILTTYPF
jgi:hypothetical protein|tara:strand:+ start:129 stop:494 length:366 start_codon:yes stop_codon:yes gene_type:complete